MATTFIVLAAFAFAQSPWWTRIFDGQSFDGWEGNRTFFRIERGAIVGGDSRKGIPQNEFMATVREYGDFELRLQCRLTGANANGGVQFRSRRIPGDNEVSGYQADMGEGWWGALYDESRRNRALQKPSDADLKRALRPGGWNDYRILCMGRRIRTWLNNIPLVDYTEEDLTIPQRGIIAIQIHGGGPSEAWYRDIRIREL